MSGALPPFFSAVGRALKGRAGGSRGRDEATSTRIPPVLHIPLPQPPSVDLGLEVASVDQLLADNAELIGRIKICYGRDRATFDREVLPVIRRYGEFVNALPATADNIFSDVGGLFRLGIEVGFYSLQGSDSYIVSGKATITARRILEPRWRFGCFLAGLTSELHRTLNQVIVTDEGGTAWPHYLGPLTPWLEQRRASRLFIRWLKDRPESRATSLFALPHVFPAPTMAHLSEDNSIVVPHMLACISGIPVPGEPNAITEVVRRASAAVLNRETESNVRRFGRQIHGAHLERYLIDAMRQLVAANPAWQPNGERSRVWVGREGLFVVWPNAAEDMRKMLEDDEIPGIPRTPDTIREILEAAGFFDPLPEGGNLWQITPPGAQNPLTAVRVSSPALLTLRDAPPGDEDLPTLLRPQAPSTSAASKPPKPSAGAPPPVPESPQRATATPVAAAPAQGTLPLSEGAQVSGEPMVVIPPEPETAAEPEGEFAEPAAGPKAQAMPESPQLQLDAPFTLDNQVRDALERAVAGFDQTVPSDALEVTERGLFVTLDLLRHERLDVRAALRSMGESALVDVDAQGSALVRSNRRGDAEIQGVTIRPDFIRGWVSPMHGPT